jgi:hypothetical protein
MGLMFLIPNHANQERFVDKYQNKNEIPIAVSPYPVEVPPVEKVMVKSIPFGEVLEKIPSKLGYNCVQFVASKRPVPQGLGTLAQKKQKIKTTEPCTHCAVVLNEGPVGHLAFVEAIRGDYLLISEGNYYHGFVTKRLIPEKKALGYF